MIVGLGIDIVERLELPEKLTLFAEKILTDKELAMFQGIKLLKKKQDYLAGRFAVKEAFVKALGTGFRQVNFKDISVLNDALGRPYVESKHAQEYQLHVTLSHARDTIVAVVILEKID